MRALLAFLRSIFVPLQLIRVVFLLYVANLVFAVVITAPFGELLERTFGKTVSGELLAREFQEFAWTDLHANESAALEAMESSGSWTTVLYLLVSFCLWSAGWSAASRRYCFGAAISGSYIAAGTGGHLYIYSL